MLYEFSVIYVACVVGRDINEEITQIICYSLLTLLYYLIATFCTFLVVLPIAVFLMFLPVQRRYVLFTIYWFLNYEGMKNSNIIFGYKFFKTI